METTMRREGLALPILVALALTVALGANGAKANAQEAVFLLHRAEVGPGWDSPLTEVGRRRVNALAHLLKDAGWLKVTHLPPPLASPSIDKASCEK